MEESALVPHKKSKKHVKRSPDQVYQTIDTTTCSPIDHIEN